jgi:hypothetical protein
MEPMRLVRCGAITRRRRPASRGSGAAPRLDCLQGLHRRPAREDGVRRQQEVERGPRTCISEAAHDIRQSGAFPGRSEARRISHQRSLNGRASTSKLQALGSWQVSW